jgi:hypothetical protein
MNGGPPHAAFRGALLESASQEWAINSEKQTNPIAARAYLRSGICHAITISVHHLEIIIVQSLKRLLGRQ